MGRKRKKPNKINVLDGPPLKSMKELSEQYKDSIKEGLSKAMRGYAEFVNRQKVNNLDRISELEAENEEKIEQFQQDSKKKE